MKLRLNYSFVLLIVLTLGGVLFLSPSVSAANLTVNSNGDTTADDGVCTLREAITAANTDTASGATPGECIAGSGADTINFSIGSGQQTISPATDLPIVAEALTIDGTTQPGGATCGTSFADRNLLIEIDGTNTPDSPLITFSTGSDGSTVRGLVINRASSVQGDGLLFSQSDNHTVQCSYLGTNVAGTAGLGDQLSGMKFNDSDNNTIGGISQGQGNILSGSNDGLILDGGSSNNTVQGNWIGIGADGSCIGNGIGQGIGVNGNNNVIGGTTAAARNIISCHSDGSGGGDGIDIIGSFGTPSISNVVQGNWIGTNVSGQVETGYGNQGSGIAVVADVEDNVIGGTTTGMGNIIAGNDRGVSVLRAFGFTPLNNSILGNVIHSNTTGGTGELGIDLFESPDFVSFTSRGVTANDTDDSDSGPNDYLNFPIITNTSNNVGSLDVSFNLDVPDTNPGVTGYRVEFFANSDPDASGNGEGEIYLGSHNIDGDVTGEVATLSIPTSFTAGNYSISATTTEIDGSADGFGATSEFGSNLNNQTITVAGAGTVGETPMIGIRAATLANTGDDSYLISIMAIVLITGSGILVAYRRITDHFN